MKKFCQRYRLEILYIVYGLLTSVVNYGVFWAALRFLGGSAALLANLAAFVAATAFAFLTNKAFVFKSRDWKLPTVCREALRFTSTRLFSFGFEELGLLFATEVLKTGEWSFWGIEGTMVAKILLSLAAVVINFFLSKFFVFHSKRVE